MRLIFSLAIASLVALATIGADAAEISGRVSASIYNHDDDVAERDYTFTRLRLKFHAADFIGDNTFLNFSGSARSSGANDFNSATPDDRIYYANLEFRRAFNFADVIVGRQYLAELAGARVDGGHLRLWLGEKFGAGLFGGMAPDPYQDTFNGDYTTYGAYLFYDAPATGLSLGYVANLYKGAEDVSYVSASAHTSLSRALTLFGRLRADHNADSGEYQVTNLLLSATYRPGPRGRISFTFNQYRAVRLYESMDYNLDHELQSTFRISGSYRLGRNLKVYGQMDARTRESDGESASLLLAGVRHQNIFNWLFYDLSYRSIHYFTSDSSQIRAALGAENGDNFTAELSAIYMKNEQDGIVNTLEQWIYAGSVDWYVTRAFYVAGKIEMSNETYLDVDAVYLLKESDTFSALTYFLYAGYRF